MTMLLTVGISRSGRFVSLTNSFISELASDDVCQVVELIPRAVDIQVRDDATFHPEHKS